MKIGELATKAGCSVETVRYYEKERLLHAPLRDQNNNYRSYDSSHLERLTFIRRCRALDMTHDEVRALLQARSDAQSACSHIDALINDHLHHVQQRIEELQALEQQLQELRQQCGADRLVSECGILRELAQPAADDTAPASASASGHLSGVHSH